MNTSGRWGGILHLHFSLKLNASFFTNRQSIAPLTITVTKFVLSKNVIFVLNCDNIQGSVVQRINSLMSSLRGQLVKCFKTSLPNILIFFVENFSNKNIRLFEMLTFTILMDR